MIARKTRCSKNIGGVLVNKKPDLVLTYEDTDSIFAEVFDVSELWTKSENIESELRSFDRLMPEEIRIFKDYEYWLNPQIAEI